MIVFKFIALLNLVMICTGLNYSKQSLPATNIFTEFLSNKTDRTSQMVDGLAAAIRIPTITAVQDWEDELCRPAGLQIKSLASNCNVFLTETLYGIKVEASKHI